MISRQAFSRKALCMRARLQGVSGGRAGRRRDLLLPGTVCRPFRVLHKKESDFMSHMEGMACVPEVEEKQRFSSCRVL